ncbi:MerR family transcriptional regulator [Meiothermus ruber]|jgi:DNA-binding transcriptional MerR regulator|uniref:MerR family transcriptional regulator n=1 Tax=Meiothermus ruber (strain ATCC 35948 / DSM 1279 / VKM B-1258 / 21) TaxID=504728 RepID=D3PM42_MEIRD|nr:MerR family transcriptional regulator [Meiothermus ruber]ADD27153.1 transcriptional regulator, MerR family [Meiothermus ruber DSM 1279]AGK03606.1 MerR family transcriptional regulator [Meiothermus ruber DSM 1279]MCL6531536.1 MerR family transcriptional regulator [Meiothermus ruber]GAO74076.1 MerR family transcriptional regulator [Meiothermus ruber H328]
MRNDLGVYTIAEVEERTGLSSALLRQWERRYGFPRPERSPGGHRLYSQTDLEALRHIKKWIAEGVAPAQAVRRYLEGLTQEGPRPPEALSMELEEALLRADTEAAERTLSEAYRLHPMETVVMEVIAPCLRRIGDGWHLGRVSTAQEHFASTYLRGTLHGLLNLMGGSLGPTLVVSTLPGEQHEIGSLITALFLRRAGYTVHYLGPNTPLADLRSFAERTGAKAVVLSAVQPVSLESLPHNALRHLAPVVVVGGRAAASDPHLVERLGAYYLGNDPRELAEMLSVTLKEAGLW